VTIIVGEGAPAARLKALSDRGAEVRTVARANGRVDLAAAFQRLGGAGMTRVLVEGGAELAGAMVDNDLVDEAYLVETPRFLGGAGLVRPFAGDARGALGRRLFVRRRTVADDDRWTHFVSRCLPGS